MYAGKEIIIERGGQEHTFRSVKDAAQYILDRKISTAKRSSVESGLTRAKNSGKRYLGFKVRDRW